MRQLVNGPLRGARLRDRDGERVARHQSDKDRSRADQRELCRAARQDDRKAGGQDGCQQESDPGPGALAEVIRNEGAVNARADRAGQDDDVDSKLGEPHLTITVPCMSWL